MIDHQQPLKKAGLKITAPRMKILHLLEEASQQDKHMSAEELHRRLLTMGEDVGLATIYRVLTQFTEAGLVRRHNFEEGYSVFELNQGEHHDHLVCIKCANVIEFMDEVIEKRQLEIAHREGFILTDHVLNIYGICGLCHK